MYSDFKDLLSAFNAHNVKYMIVGGYAVSFYSQPRATKDLDLFIKADPANAQATYAALAWYGATLGNITVGDLSDPNKFIRFGIEPIAVDIMPGILGVDFDAAWDRRVQGTIKPEGEIKAIFISREDLIASQRASGRLRDLADVEAIEEAAESERK